MPYQTQPRPGVLAGSNVAGRKPLPNARQMESYRVLQGEKVRQYYTIGDPVQHMQWTANMRRLGLIALGFVVLIALLLVFIV